uniref:Uncharacterized protein n=1 Tax=Caenorhabditis japonica TaxID=281687 RepID=A0A8R1ED57_CAEJA
MSHISHSVYNKVSNVVERILFWRWSARLNHSVYLVEAGAGAALVLHHSNVRVHPGVRHLEGTRVPMLQKNKEWKMSMKM